MIKKRQNPEHNLQTFFVHVMRLYNVFHFAIPNGGKRNAIAGAKLKDEGALAGAADLVVMFPGKLVFVEMKTPKTEQTVLQKKFQSEVERLGFEYVVLKDYKQCVEFLKNNGVKARFY